MNAISHFIKLGKQETKFLFLPCTSAQLTEFISLAPYIDYVT